MEGFEGSRGGVAALGLRDRAGLADLRRGSGETGTGVLDLDGSSTMYMGVSMSRNSIQGSMDVPAQQQRVTHRMA